MKGSSKMLVAIDGPSGVGKSTAARRVAELLEIPYLDTGAMYRCLALHADRSNRAHDVSEETVSQLLQGLQLDLQFEGGKAWLRLDGEDVDREIRTPRISEITSRFAAHATVRKSMVARQQRFGALYGGVVEGRDIGTVVFPHTPYKFFLQASIEVRAMRRYLELKERHPELTLDEVTSSIAQRDQRDSDRAASPLERTPEHVLVDTGSADAETVARRIVDFVGTASVTVR